MLNKATSNKLSPNNLETHAIFGKFHPASDRSGWVDRADHGWGKDVGGGGEEIIPMLMMKNKKRAARTSSPLPISYLEGIPCITPHSLRV
jgi:hypothetical protein